MIDSDNHGYGTHTWLHYTVNDIMPQMTQVYIFYFCSSVEAGSDFLWDLLNFMKLYDACGFWLHYYWTEIRKCTLWSINFLKCKRFWVMISWSKNFPGKNVNTLWHYLVVWIYLGHFKCQRYESTYQLIFKEVKIGWSFNRIGTDLLCINNFR